MILYGIQNTRTFTLMFHMAMVALINSCAPHAHVVGVKYQDPDYVVKEVRVTGRPIVGNSDIVPLFEIHGIKDPGGKPFSIFAPVSVGLLKQKLDPQKSYRFHLYTTDQRRQYIDFKYHQYHATLWQVEEDGSVILDTSICDVHHCAMDFVEAENINYGFESEKGNRELGVFHNHGYSVTGCGSLPGNRDWTWRCPRCAKKVAKFWQSIP